MLLKARQLEIRQKTLVIRLQTLAAEVQFVVEKMILKGDKLTRRAIERRLRTSGISVQRREAHTVRELVSAAANLLIAASESQRFSSEVVVPQKAALDLPP